MKQLFFLLLVLVSFATVTNAQNDPKAKQILDNVSAKLKSFKGVSAKFSYVTKDKKNIRKGSVNGSIDIKGQKYFIKQGANEIYCNGSNTWNYNKDNNEVTVTTVDNDDAKALTPQKLLSSSLYDKDYTCKLISSKGQYHEVRMTPTDKRKNFKQVTVFVDKNKNIITKAKILDKSDNTIEFVLSNVNTNAKLADSKFEFNTKIHPGVEVIEN